MRMGWLKVSDGSTGSLTPRLLKIRSEGGARPSGWTGKQTGRPQSVALQRRSGGVALPAWTGGPAGPVGPPVRVAQPGSKTRPGRWGHWDRPFFQYSPLGLNASVRRQCYWKNGKNGKSCALIPTASRPQGICQNRLPKSEMAKRFKGEEDGKTTMFAQLADD